MNPQPTNNDAAGGGTQYEIITPLNVQHGDQYLLAHEWHPLKTNQREAILRGHSAWNGIKFRRPTAPALPKGEETRDHETLKRGYACAAGNHKLCGNKDCECECHAPPLPSTGGATQTPITDGNLVRFEQFDNAFVNEHVVRKIEKELAEANHLIGLQDQNMSTSAQEWLDKDAELATALARVHELEATIASYRTHTL